MPPMALSSSLLVVGSAEARDARALASRHQAMHRAYVGSKSANKQAFEDHCDRLSKQQEALAKEYDALAELHEQEAKKAAQ